MPSSLRLDLPSGFEDRFAVSLASGFAVSLAASPGRKFASSERSGFESAKAVSQALDFLFSLLVILPVSLPVFLPRSLPVRFRFSIRHLTCQDTFGKAGARRNMVRVFQARWFIVSDSAEGFVAFCPV